MGGFTMGRPSPSKLPHLIHSSLGAPEASTQTALERFSRFYTAHYYDRPTDHATWSVTIGRIYVRSMVVLRCGLKTYLSKNLMKNHV